MRELLHGVRVLGLADADGAASGVPGMPVVEHEDDVGICDLRGAVGVHVDPRVRGWRFLVQQLDAEDWPVEQALGA